MRGGSLDDLVWQTAEDIPVKPLYTAADIEGLDRIRFLTSNPFDMTEDMMRRFGALPKVMASQCAWKIATWTLEIHGGSGYMKEVGVEKLVRDAAAFLHSDGVNRTLFLKAANFMFS